MARLLLASLALAALAPRLAAAEPARCPPACELGELAQRAGRLDPDLDAAEAAFRREVARREEARSVPARLVDARLEVAPTALRRGDVSTADQGDVSFSRETGMQLGLRLQAVVPVTSWWRIASLWRAADGAVELAEADLDRRRSEQRLLLERAYREAQRAGARADAVAEARRRVRRALERAELLLAEDLPGADETDRLRLELTAAELEAELAADESGRRRSLARLRTLAGLPGRARLELPPLDARLPSLAPLEWYAEAARRGRPEVRMSLAAARSARARIGLDLGELVPDVGLAGYYSLRRTPVVDDQTSSFIHDPWNGLTAGYGLAWSWSVDPLGTAARVGRSRADLALAGALGRLALGAVAFEVEAAWADAVEAASALEARERGREGARRLLEVSLAAPGADGFDATSLTRAVRTWLDQELAWADAAAAALLAHARLARAAALSPAGPVTAP